MTRTRVVFFFFLERGPAHRCRAGGHVHRDMVSILKCVCRGSWTNACPVKLQGLRSPWGVVSLGLPLLTASRASPPLSSSTVQRCGGGRRDRLTLMPQHGAQPSLPAMPGIPMPHRDQLRPTACSCMLVTHTEVSNQAPGGGGGCGADAVRTRCI